jgi:hypothetical protein
MCGIHRSCQKPQKDLEMSNLRAGRLVASHIGDELFNKDDYHSQKIGRFERLQINIS